MIDLKQNIQYIKGVGPSRVELLNKIGACANCQMLDLTLREGIEAAIKEEIPTVKEVINVRN